MKIEYEGFIWADRFDDFGKKSYLGNCLETPGLVIDKSKMKSYRPGEKLPKIIKVKITVEKIDE
jgi:hypothetical protein